MSLMRRSTVVQLTLLPMLASAAVASADITDDPPPLEPTTPDIEPPLAPPGMTAAVGVELAPPGMTRSIMELDCDDDPNWRLRPDCDEVVVDGYTVIRGGFGGYFWTGGG